MGQIIERFHSLGTSCKSIKEWKRRESGKDKTLAVFLKNTAGSASGPAAEFTFRLPSFLETDSGEKSMLSIVEGEPETMRDGNGGKILLSATKTDSK